MNIQFIYPNFESEKGNFELKKFDPDIAGFSIDMPNLFKYASYKGI